MATVAWSTALLDLLKAPKTPANYQFLNQWLLREHAAGDLYGKQYGNNPFFTTAGGSGSVGKIKAGTFPRMPGNSAGVAMYPNLETGVFVNAYHIASGYPSIAAALRSGNPASMASNPGFQRDLLRWSGSGYSGFQTIAAPAAPVGATVDTSKIGGAALAAAGAGGHSIAGDLNAAARHIPGVAQAEGVASAAGSAAGFLAKLTDPAYILRGLQIVAGGALVGVGAVLLARQVALAADLPDPALLAGPVGKVGAAAAGAAAAQTPARREGRRIEDAARERTGGRAPRPAREGVKVRTESVDAATGKTRAQERSERAARRDSSPGPADDIPF